MINILQRAISNTNINRPASRSAGSSKRSIEKIMLKNVVTIVSHNFFSKTLMKLQLQNMITKACQWKREIQTPHMHWKMTKPLQPVEGRTLIPLTVSTTSILKMPTQTKALTHQVDNFKWIWISYVKLDYNDQGERNARFVVQLEVSYIKLIFVQIISHKSNCHTHLLNFPLGCQMIEHKCSFKAFVKVTKFLNLTERVHSKILATPFNHFLTSRIDLL